MTSARGHDNARDTFPKAGDYATVENVSGSRWPGAEMTARPAITPPPPGRAMSPRRSTMIDAETGQALGEMTEGAVARAARHLSIRRETVEQSHPSARPMLRHLFGLNLPGRQ